MKNLIILITLIATINASFAADVVCAGRSDKRTFPLNKLAIKISLELGLKACNGYNSDTFRSYVKSKGHSFKTVIVTKSDLKQVKALRPSKANAKKLDFSKFK